MTVRRLRKELLEREHPEKKPQINRKKELEHLKAKLDSLRQEIKDLDEFTRKAREN